MKAIATRLALAAALLSAAPLASAEQAVPLTAQIGECQLFRLLNGSKAVPARCQDDSKSPFGEQPQLARRLLLETLNFEFNKQHLVAREAAILELLARVMADPVSKDQRYLIEGHTDSVGKPEDNQYLSERRAGSVRRFLAEHGVPRERLYAEGFGERRLADPGDPTSGVNRRVEIVNLTQVQAITGQDGNAAPVIVQHADRVNQADYIEHADDVCQPSEGGTCVQGR